MEQKRQHTHGHHQAGPGSQGTSVGKREKIVLRVISFSQITLGLNEQLKDKITVTQRFLFIL